MVVVPDRGEQLLARADPARMPDQVGEQHRLALREADGDLPAPGLPGHEVEPDASRLDDRVRALARLAEARPDAGQELVEGERLGDVVGGAEVEPFDPVGDLAPGGQHDHRQRRPRAADRREDVDSVFAGQHPVEDDEVRLGAEGEPLAADPVGGNRDAIALRFEPSHQEVGDPRLVLNDQDLHPGDATPCGDPFPQVPLKNF